MASQHINIHNSGVMSGNVTTAGDVNVMPGGTLRVAKTTIGGNLENGGTVQMNSEGGKPGNVLTVNGNYTGNNGLMTFNATLGGDNSPTDKMNVKGDTQGNTRVRVDNIGGVGAQTVNGIELIEVGGNSAGNFALTTGTVEAGAYVYTLAKGKGNDEKNWYLTSKWDGVTPPDTPDPINNPPVVDPEGPSVYRPEAGSYISNIAAANSPKGKKTAIDKIYPRHFLATAKVLRFPEVQMHEILSDFARMIPAALDNVKTSLPTDFPENVVTAVETNVLRLHGRLSREYGSK